MAYTFENLETKYERRLNVLREIRKLLNDDPAFADEIVSSLGGASTTPASNPRQSGGNGQKTQFETIQDYFRDTDNQWVSVAEIAKRTDLSKGAVGQVIYKAKPDEFASKEHPEGKRRKLWRLKSEGGEPCPEET